MSTPVADSAAPRPLAELEGSVHEGDRAIHPTIEPLFEKLGELCSLPSVALQVIQVSEDPDSDAEDVLRVIEQDPAVAARLMQVVNSSYCGLASPATDLKTAVTMLGLDRVRALALTVSIGGMFGRDTPVGRLDPERMWDHCVCVATVSRMIARKSGACHAEEAYLTGLLHDLGLLIIGQNLHQLTPRVLARCASGQALSEAERHVFGFDHAQVGAYIAWRSRLPERIVSAIDYHHDP